MWVWASIASAILLQAPPQIVKTVGDASVVITVQLGTYRSDGTASSVAGFGLREDAAGRAWLDPARCMVTAAAAGASAQPSNGSVSWTAFGRLVRHDGTDYVVEVTFARSEGLATTRTITLRVGEPAVLDEMSEVPGVMAACGARGVRLEVEATERPAPRPPVRAGTAGRGGGGGGAVTGRGIAATGPAGGGVGGAGGGGVITPEALGLARLAARTPTSAADLVDIPTPVDHMRIARPDGVVADDAVPVELRNLSAASYDAELWLISTGSDGRSQTQFRTGHLDALGRIFTFPQVRVKTSTGVVRSVDVAVNLRPMAIPQGALVLRAAIGRFVENSGWGVMDKALPMPDRGDVVSFEMPNGPWREGPRSNLHDDAMSVRVRITPSREQGK